MKEASISKYEESTYACPVDEQGSDYSIPGPTHYSNPEMLHPDSRKYFTGTENNNIQEFYHEEDPDADSSYTDVSSNPLPGRNISFVKNVDDSKFMRHNGIANEIYEEPLPLAQQVINVLILLSFNLVNIMCAANFHGIFRHLLRTNPYLTELETTCCQR